MSNMCVFVGVSKVLKIQTGEYFAIKWLSFWSGRMFLYKINYHIVFPFWGRCSHTTIRKGLGGAGVEHVAWHGDRF